MICMLIFAIMLAACSAPYEVPIDNFARSAERIETEVMTIYTGNLDAEEAGSRYQVRRGDTLLSIAWRFEQDPDVLKQRNQMISDAVQIGQSLKLKGLIPAQSKPERQLQPQAAPPPSIKAESEQVSEHKTSQNLKKPSKPVVKRQPKAISTPKLKGWQWPVNGPVLEGYSERSRSTRSLQLGGRAGSLVKAAANGRVVYAGDGLVGFGNLIIISHDKKLLSAYGHNQSLRVKVGDVVKVGEIVAEMGSTGTDRVKLHFEIRKHGSPINPISLLPKRDS